MGMAAMIGPLIGGLTSGLGSLFGGNSKADAATQAAQAQVTASQHGMDAINGIMSTQKDNASPFINAGDGSLAQLMSGLMSGHFGSGSSGTVPAYGGGSFTAPTQQEAEQTPGYQFTAQQGSKGILQGAAAAGGAISGGTLRALAGYNSGLANSTYNDVFNRSMGTFNAGLAQHQAQLADYGAKLQGNQQEFNQLFAPTQLGATSAGQLNQTLTQQGENIANLYTNQGNSKAAGIIGANNASTGGWQGAINQFTSPSTLGGLMGLFTGGGGGGGPVSNGSNIPYMAPPLNLGSLFPSTGGVGAPPPVGPAPVRTSLGLGPG